MASKPDYSNIASALLGGKPPLAFKHYPDGSLNVIAPSGQKYTFTPAQVEQEQKKQEKQSKPAPQTAPKAAKTPRKAPNKK